MSKEIETETEQEIEVDCKTYFATICNFKYNEINAKFNDLNITELKDICRENEIIGFSALKKYELINLIIKDYDKYRQLFCKFSFIELQNILTHNSFKIIGKNKKVSKDILIHIIVSSFFINNLFNPSIFNVLTPHNKNKFREYLAELLIDKKLDKDDLLAVVKKLRKVAINDVLDNGVCDLFNESEYNKLNDEYKDVINGKLVYTKAKKDKLRKTLDDKDIYYTAKAKQYELEQAYITDVFDKILAKIENNTINIETSNEKPTKIETPKIETPKEKIPKEKPTKIETPKVEIKPVEGILIKLVEESEPEPEPEPEPQITNQPKKRVALPKSVRDSVWNHYIGEDINKHRCLCCKKVLITNRQFDVGHVISVNDGGTHEINNLRPICFPCNHSMGTTNMIEFVKTYGYYIG